MVFYFVLHDTFGKHVYTCGAPPCTCFKELHIIDCSSLGLEIYPAFEDYWVISTVAIYFNNNNLGPLVPHYFNKWISLENINLQNNPNFDCGSLAFIPQWVNNILSDCHTSTSSDISTNWQFPTNTTSTAITGEFLC